MDKIDWHAGFVSAMRLELMKDDKFLEFIEEYVIANRAQRIDLLIIKKIKETKISKSIGEIFGKYNIIEYKGPGDQLTYEDFHKVQAYAHLYFYENRCSKEAGADDYTVTIVRETYPCEMIKLMRRDGLVVTETTPGIYNVAGRLSFRTQIIVSKRLKPHNDYVWLKSLTRKGNRDNVANIVNESVGLIGRYKNYADNVMDVFAKGNQAVIKKMEKEDANMCEEIEKMFARRHKEEYEAMMREKESLSKEKESLSKKMESLSREKESLSRTLYEKSTDLDEKNQEISLLKSQLEEMSKLLNKLQAQKA